MNGREEQTLKRKTGEECSLVFNNPWRHCVVSFADENIMMRKGGNAKKIAIPKRKGEINRKFNQMVIQTL